MVGDNFILTTKLGKPDLGFWADIASLSGFLISLVAIVTSFVVKSRLKKFREEIFWRRRIPEILRQLRTYREELYSLLVIISNDDSKLQVHACIKKSQATLESVEKNIHGIRDVAEAVTIGKQIISGKYDKKEVEKFYLAIIGIEARLQLELKDQKEDFKG